MSHPHGRTFGELWTSESEDSATVTSNELLLIAMNCSDDWQQQSYW